MIGRLLNGAIESEEPIRLNEAELVTCELQVTRLYEEAREDVYRYLLTLGLAPPQAQEAAQEVFLRLYADLQKGKRIDNLRGWVFRVAHNHGVTQGQMAGVAAQSVMDLDCKLARWRQNQCARGLRPRMKALFGEMLEQRQPESRSFPGARLGDPDHVASGEDSD